MVSNEKSDGPGKRPYTLKARARRLEEVRRRITLAAVELHGTVGPARTTVSDVARLAGVRRTTVYNHFPTEMELIDACSSHWFAENPPPDPSPWAKISDPRERATFALNQLYGYYAENREMLSRVLRDAPLVPALAEIVRQKWQPLVEGIVGILEQGWEIADRGKGGGRRKASGEFGSEELQATLHAVLDYFTWQVLADSGLSTERAARLAVRWIGSVLEP